MTEASETVQSLTPADGMRWYVVHAYSGMEKAVERNIMERVGNAGMEAKFGRTLVPTGRFNRWHHHSGSSNPHLKRCFG